MKKETYNLPHIVEFRKSLPYLVEQGTFVRTYKVDKDKTYYRLFINDNKTKARLRHISETVLSDKELQKYLEDGTIELYEMVVDCENI